MPSQEIGSLIVSLRANSAEFKAQMDAARDTTRRTGETAVTSSRQIARLASEGFGAILPISFQAERGIARFIESALRGQGALALVGKATLLLGAGFAAFELGKKAGEFISLGTTLEKYNEQTKKATEEQKNFLAQLSKQTDVLRGLQKELASVQLLQGPSLQGTLKEITAAQEERDAKIRQAFGPNQKRTDAIALSAKLALEQEKKALDEFRKLRDEADQKLLDTILGERETREKANIAAATSLGLGGTSLFEGFKDIGQLQQDLVDFQNGIRDLAKAGIPARDIFDEITKAQGGFDTKMSQLEERFKDQPPLLDKLRKSLGDLQFGGLQRVLDDVVRSTQNAKQGFASLIDTSEGIETKWTPILKGAGVATSEFRNSLNTVAPAAAVASSWVTVLTDDVFELARAFQAARVENLLLTAQIGQSVEGTTPVPFGGSRTIVDLPSQESIQ